MGDSRRQFCALTVGTLASLAGCAGLDNAANEVADVSESPATSTEAQTLGDIGDIEAAFPDPGVEELISPESQLVSTDQLDQSTFTVTVQNTGYGGNIGVALFWQMDETAPGLNGVGSLQEGYQREQKEELYFNSDERRTIEMAASPPDEAIGFTFVAQPATHGAVITNQGAAGRVEVTHTYSMVDVGLEQTESQTIYLEEEETREVMFDTLTDPGSEWEISAEAAPQS